MKHAKTYFIIGVWIILVCATAVSFSDTVELYRSAGIAGGFEWLNELLGLDNLFSRELFATIAAEIGFIMGLLGLLDSQMRGVKPTFKTHWQEYMLFFAGLIIVGWSNISETVGYNYLIGQPHKGIALGISIPLFVFGAESVLSKHYLSHKQQVNTSNSTRKANASEDANFDTSLKSTRNGDTNFAPSANDTRNDTRIHTRNINTRNEVVTSDTRNSDTSFDTNNESTSSKISGCTRKAGEIETGDTKNETGITKTGDNQTGETVNKQDINNDAISAARQSVSITGVSTRKSGETQKDTRKSGETQKDGESNSGEIATSTNNEKSRSSSTRNVSTSSSTRNLNTSFDTRNDDTSFESTSTRNLVTSNSTAENRSNVVKFKKRTNGRSTWTEEEYQKVREVALQLREEHKKKRLPGRPKLMEKANCKENLARRVIDDLKEELKQSG